MKERTVFLSHSSKDIDKVRKIRDILETLDYDPLLFHMKCLDDNNEMLEDFIKREIEARNVFVYCRSKNSEGSIWVQKELDYIRNAKNKRLYSIDIERPLRETLVTFLQTLAEIIQNNKVFISCSHADRTYSDRICEVLESAGYDVVRYNTFNRNKYFQHDEDIEMIARNGIFLPVITANYIKSVYCVSETEKVLHHYAGGKNEMLFRPVYVNVNPKVAMSFLPSSVSDCDSLYIEDIDMLSDEKEIDKLLIFMQRKSGSDFS